MSRYNPAHAALFGGVVPLAVARKAPLVRSCVVELIRTDLDGGRGRFRLDHAAQLEIHPAVDDVLCCELSWADGSIESNVRVTAVHRDGFVDVHGYSPICDDAPLRVRLRRWPQERQRVMASERAEKIESARRAYAAALGTENEAATRTELEKLVADAKAEQTKKVIGG